MNNSILFNQMRPSQPQFSNFNRSFGEPESQQSKGEHKLQ